MIGSTYLGQSLSWKVNVTNLSCDMISISIICYLSDYCGDNYNYSKIICIWDLSFYYLGLVYSNLNVITRTTLSFKSSWKIQQLRLKVILPYFVFQLINCQKGNSHLSEIFYLRKDLSIVTCRVHVDTRSWASGGRLEIKMLS